MYDDNAVIQPFTNKVDPVFTFKNNDLVQWLNVYEKGWSDLVRWTFWKSKNRSGPVSTTIKRLIRPIGDDGRRNRAAAQYVVAHKVSRSSESSAKNTSRPPLFTCSAIPTSRSNRYVVECRWVSHVDVPGCKICTCKSNTGYLPNKKYALLNTGYLT